MDGSLWIRSQHAVLDWLESQHNIKIQRNVNLGMVMTFDGFHRDDSGNVRVFEYHNCYWHGCEKCYPHVPNTSGLRVIGKEKRNVLLQRVRDMKKRKVCKELGYELQEVWTHDIHNNMYIKERKKEHVRRRKIPSIKHREALYGGRTNATVLFYECKSTEKIQYFDINGLYPHVMMNKTYPCAHPKMIFEFPSENLNDYFLRGNFFGLIEAKVKTPLQLKHPVLPVKINGKLMFPLCELCASESCRQCNHGNRRGLTGVWFTEEVKYAIHCGYEIVEIFQIENYPVSDIAKNPFRLFVSPIMKRKKEAEGGNGRVPNPSMRTLNKLAGNSIWGKFATNPRQDNITYLRTPESLYNLLGDADKKVKDVLDLGTSLRVVYETEDNFIMTPSYTSLISAIMVTAYARLEILKHIHSIPPDDVLYFDTDSIIFVQHGDINPIQNIGPECGQISCELPPGAFIKKFASTGPKSYAYLVFYPESGEEKLFIKVKGITLDKNVREKYLHTMDNTNFIFDFVKENYAFGKTVKPMELPQIKIRATERNELLTKSQQKKFGNRYDKRFIIEDLKTLPWGYINDAMDLSE